MKKHTLLLPIVLSAITAAPIITPFVTVAASEQTSVENPQQVTKVHVTYKTPDGTVIDDRDHDLPIGEQFPFVLSSRTFMPQGYSDVSLNSDQTLISQSNLSATFIVNKTLNIPLLFIDENGNILAKSSQAIALGTDLTNPAIPLENYFASDKNEKNSQGIVIFHTVTNENPLKIYVELNRKITIKYVDSDTNQVIGESKFETGYSKQFHPQTWLADVPENYYPDPNQPSSINITSDIDTITDKIVNLKNYVLTFFLDEAGNKLTDRPVVIKRNSNGAIDVSSKIPAGYHLPSGSTALVTPPTDRSSWNVTVTNKKNSDSSTPSQPSNPIYIQPNTPAPESKYEKFDGTATIMSDNANLYSNTDLSVSLNRHLAKGTSWHIFGVQRTGGDTTAYNLGGSQWISARDVLIADNAAQPSTKPTQPNPEIALSGTFTVKVPNHPTWSTVLWDKDGNPTSHFLKPNTSWKVYAKKFTGGKTYYRLGSQNQWVEANYGALK